MRGALIGWFVLVIAGMLWFTVDASRDRGLFEAGGMLWREHLWFRATLADAYFAFLAVWLWMAWREPTVAKRLIWLVAVLTLGSFAIAGYALIALFRWRARDGVAALLLGPHRQRELAV